jgi:hypothetical protein
MIRRGVWVPETVIGGEKTVDKWLTMHSKQESMYTVSPTPQGVSVDFGFTYQYNCCSRSSYDLFLTDNAHLP